MKKHWARHEVALWWNHLRYTERIEAMRELNVPDDRAEELAEKDWLWLPRWAQKALQRYIFDYIVHKLVSKTLAS